MSLSDQIETLLQEQSAEIFDPASYDGPEDCPEAVVLTNFVCISEWADGKGHKWLTHHAPPTAPYWHLAGMLDAAKAEFTRRYPRS